MTRHNLIQRLEVLERGQDDGDGGYCICIGDDDCPACLDDQMARDGFTRLAPERVTIDIGGGDDDC